MYFMKDPQSATFLKQIEGPYAREKPKAINNISPESITGARLTLNSSIPPLSHV